MENHQTLPKHINYPKLRALEMAQVEDENGGQFVCLQDPMGYSENAAYVPLHAMPILQFFDGNNSIRDIQEHIMQKFGTLINSEDILTVIRDLDSVCFLEGETFDALKQKIVSEYREMPARPAKFSGQAYPREKAMITKLFDSFFDGQDGPAMPEKRKKKSAPKAIIAPHVNIPLGGTSFAHAYKEIMESAPADLYLILGTGHRPMDNPFAATTKNFETPFGIAETDNEFLSKLNNSIGFDLFHDEPAHIAEHTIEFQVVFLQYALGCSVKIAPILCSFPCFYPAGIDIPYSGINSREQGAVIENFASELGKAIAGYNGRVCVIVSADFAHVGKNYGDEFNPEKSDIERICELDRATLDTIGTGDASLFLQNIVEDNDRRQICGFAPIYTLLKTMPGLSGQMLSYGYCDIDSDGSIVSFAGMSFK